ncbi:MAG: uroporphyrinogen decarboxylase family protein, partial [Anaerolineae bacterium]
MTLSALENFKTILRGESPQWIPFTLDVGAIPGFTESVQRRFEEKTGECDPAEFFDFDFRIISVALRYGGQDPRKYHDDIPADTKFDEWGIGHWAGGAKDTYEKMFPPIARTLTVNEVRALPEPVIDSAGVAERVRNYHERGYPVVGYTGSIYEWSWWLRGMERFMIDLLLAPDLAQAIIEKATAFTKNLALESAKLGIDVLAFYDDAGMQTGMQISPALWRQLVKPAWQEVLITVREKYPNTAFFLHSCGNIRPIVPDIIELGFDILHPVQPECMDPVKLKKEFGDRILLCGTLGAQQTFPFGTAEEVKLEIMRLMDTLGQDRRCILCPSNRIQPETPWENIMAFVQTARSYK